MFSRSLFLIFALFWLTMTYLLWRSEYLVQNNMGSSVPAALVWRKILSAPDNSTMQILHNGHKSGYCRLSSNIGQELADSKILNEDDTSPSDSFAPPPTGTRLSLDGNIVTDEIPGRLQFNCELGLTTNNNDWNDFHLKLGVKPSSWEIYSSAKDRTVRLQIDDQTGKSTRVYKFADLQNPEFLTREFELPVPLGLMATLAPPGQQSTQLLALGLNWKARNDWISIGHTSVRVYRLEASLLDRYRLRIIVSQVGEIVRVELPDGWLLVNDQLLTL